jgi:excisionase family DNA binding protein
MSDIADTIEVPRLLTLKEAADVLNVSRATLYKLDRQGALPIYTIAGRRQCIAAEIKAYIESVTGRRFGGEDSAEDNSKPSATSKDDASAVLSQHRTRQRLIG